MALKKVGEGPKIGTRHVTPSFQRDAGVKGPSGSPRQSRRAVGKIEHATGVGTPPNKNPNEGKLARTAQTGRATVNRPGRTIPASQTPAGRARKKIG
jgi:hypothetical protein